MLTLRLEKCLCLVSLCSGALVLAALSMLVYFHMIYNGKLAGPAFSPIPITDVTWFTAII